MTSISTTHSRRIAGLDGLRAVAVLAVLAFHADMSWAVGGFLGVDLFFVLSGFLISGLIAAEVERTGRLSARNFYWRRAKRLLPASWLMIAILLLLVPFIAPDALAQLQRDALASIAYVTNWSLLWSEISYFESFGRQPLLQHMWSLAIEEQFYIVWALLLPWLLVRFGRRRAGFISAILAVASLLWMQAVATSIGYPQASADPSRLYFGTDTHGFPLLIGATLALLWQPSSERSAFPKSLAFALPVAILLLFAFVGEQTTWLYPWGFLLAALISAGLIMLVSDERQPLSALLEAGPVRWIGERSYGIYLWHWPVFMLTRPGVDLPWSEASALPVRIALPIVLAALSYRFIEQPVRDGAIERLWRRWKERPRVAPPARLPASHIIAPALLALVLLKPALTPSPVTADITQSSALDHPVCDLPVVREQFGLPPSGPFDPPPVDIPAPSPAIAFAADPQAHPPTPSPSPASGATPHNSFDAVQTLPGHDVTVLGDSVMLGTSRALSAKLPGNDLHATVGWQAAAVLQRLRTLSASGSLRQYVVIHLGTNGYVQESQLRQMLGMLSDRSRVILVNTHVPRRWMAPNNQLFERVHQEFPNVRLVRWSDLAAGHPEYFVADRVHLTPTGQRALAANIAAATAP